MSNPLLELRGLPPFSEIRPEHIEPAIDELLTQSRAQVTQLLEQNLMTSLRLTQQVAKWMIARAEKEEER